MLVNHSNGTYEETSKTVVRHYACLADYAVVEEPAPHNIESHESTKRTAYDQGRRWLGVDTVEELEEAVKHGWTDGVKRTYAALGKLAADITPVSIKRRLSRGDQGDEFDIHRAYSGGLDQAWSRRKRQARVAGGATITIGISIGILYDEHADTQFWRGAACIRLADILTEAGYQVEVMAYHYSTSVYPDAETGKDSLKTIVAKPANAPLDMSALASLVALAGTTRWYSFLSYDNDSRVTSSSLGRSHKTYALKGADICIRKCDIADQASAETFINAAIEQINSRTKLAA